MSGQRMLLGLPLLAGCLWAAAPGEGAASKSAPSAKEVQDVVFLAEGRPILIRLRVRVDGKPYQEVWEAFIDRVFRYLDVNKDGVLSKAEAERAPPVQALFSNGFFGGAPPVMRALDTNRDGKVSRQELADYYRRSGAAPFQFGAGGRNVAAYRVFLANGMMAGGRPSADELNKRLFELLDTNKDGKLSRKELEAGPAILAKLDENDDEMIEVSELIPGPRPGGYENVVFVDRGMAGPPSAGNANFRLVSGDRADPALARQLLAKYGKGAKKLSRKALGLGKEAFDALDADGDGELDAEELARFARRAPDLELRIDVGGSAAPGPGLRRLKKPAGAVVRVVGGQPVAGASKVELVKGVGDPSVTRRVKPSRGGGLVLDLGNTRLELGELARPGMGGSFVFNVRQQYLAQFKAADRDGNGYLDAAEARASPLFRNLFKLMDRDGDGKLFRKEVIAFLDEMEALQKVATASCVSMRVSDDGKGLFDLLDKDGDGRLSVRELRQLPKLLEKLDADGDGELSLSEVPRSYRLSVARGPANAGGFGPQVVAFAPGVGMPRPPAPPRTRGPLWFRKMDRNRDGDVSRSEFIGTDEEFRKIDADGDGLISPEEAERYDREVRKAKATKK